jgi:hypothetical protein
MTQGRQQSGHMTQARQLLSQRRTRLNLSFPGHRQSRVAQCSAVLCSAVHTPQAPPPAASLTYTPSSQVALCSGGHLCQQLLGLCTLTRAASCHSPRSCIHHSPSVLILTRLTQPLCPPGTRPPPCPPSHIHQQVLHMPQVPRAPAAAASPLTDRADLPQAPLQSNTAVVAGRHPPTACCVCSQCKGQ